jgi:citrate lyase beta subunit
MSESLEQSAAGLFRERLELPESVDSAAILREPVHVAYGGANLFKAGTPAKFGSLALGSIERFAPDFAAFANAMWLRGADTLPRFAEVVAKLGDEIADDPDGAKARHPEAWFAWTVHRRVVAKLKTEPVEDFRIDFEDGYGIRSDDEEDAHAVSASDELATVLSAPEPDLAFSGLRIKSFQSETYHRAVRTLDLFLNNLITRTSGNLPRNFVVTLPKIRRAAEVAVLAHLLDLAESSHGMHPGSIGIEVMIETPEAVLGAADLVRSGRGRVRSAHFGAFDYTAALGVTADHQHLQHDACRFARQMMQASLTPLGVRLSDSVTTEMPVPVHRGPDLSPRDERENRSAVHSAWRKHFNNVTQALVNGFYQGWDLHPAQLAARYAALFAFFLESADAQAERLGAFIGKATRAMMTGNVFDDAASAQGLLNFFLRAARCGAMTVEEVTDRTGLTPGELASASFAKIMDSRR